MGDAFVLREVSFSSVCPATLDLQEKKDWYPAAEAEHDARLVKAGADGRIGGAGRIGGSS
jgi:hypothetical protein